MRMVPPSSIRCAQSGGDGAGGGINPFRPRGRSGWCGAAVARGLRPYAQGLPHRGHQSRDQTRLLLIVECGVERLYRGPHGIERRHESSQSLSLTSAVRLIHRRRLSCREANVEGVQRRHHSSLRGHRGYAIFQSNGLSIGRRGVAEAMGLTRRRRTTIAIYRRF